MGKFTDYMGKKMNDLGKKVEEKLEQADDALGKKVEGVKETWKNVDKKTKKDIRNGAIGGGAGLLVGGIPGLVGLGYATKKAIDAYKREKEKKEYKSK